MDIDDILAEVSRDSPAQQHEQAARDLQELTRLWVSERVAPEILPYPDALMERVLGRVRSQVCGDHFSSLFFPPRGVGFCLLLLLLLLLLG